MNKQQAPPPGFMPQPGFAPPPPYSSATAAGPSPSVNVVTVTNDPYGPYPQSMTCPYCASTVVTSVEQGPSTKTHLFALLLCIIGCWPCAPCPYCTDSCLVQKHFCPNCRRYLGMHES